MWLSAEQTLPFDLSTLPQYGLYGLGIAVLAWVAWKLIVREQSRTDAAEARVVAMSDQQVAATTALTTAMTTIQGISDTNREVIDELRRVREQRERLSDLLREAERTLERLR